MLLNILIFILALYVFSQIMVRFVAPWLLRRYVRKMQQRMNPDAYEHHKKKQGDIHIPRKQKSKPTRTYGNAEYIDYEDVSDKQ